MVGQVIVIGGLDFPEEVCYAYSVQERRFHSFGVGTVFCAYRVEAHLLLARYLDCCQFFYRHTCKHVYAYVGLLVNVFAGFLLCVFACKIC
jgi:hypothetical protein